MKRTRSMTIKESAESRELMLYAVNDGKLYEFQIVPVLRNLAKKYSKGVFDADKAIDAFYYIADHAAKKYCREFASYEDLPHMFSVTDRFTAAAEMVEYYLEDIENGEV